MAKAKPPLKIMENERLYNGNLIVENASYPPFNKGGICYQQNILTKGRLAFATYSSEDSRVIG